MQIGYPWSNNPKDESLVGVAHIPPDPVVCFDLEDQAHSNCLGITIFCKVGSGSYEGKG